MAVASTVGAVSPRNGGYPFNTRTQHVGPESDGSFVLSSMQVREVIEHDINFNRMLPPSIARSSNGRHNLFFVNVGTRTVRAIRFLRSR